MRKHRILRLMAGLLCLALLIAALPTRASRAESALAAGYVNTAKLNIRKGAGTGNAIVDTLAKNTAVNIYEVVGTWLRVDVPSTGKSGYVSGKYITVDSASLSAYALGVTSGKVNLRKEATSKSESLAVVANNAGLTIWSADAKTGWYKVKVHATGKEGYISPLYVKIVSKAGSGMTPGEITAYNVNLRSGPSTSYNRIATLQKSDALTILEKSGDWYKVTVKATGKTGYVYASYVKIVSSGATPTPVPTATPTPASGTRGTINASGVNFRTGPGTDYKIQSTLNKGTAVTVLGTSGNWLKITVDATAARGYVFAAYVTVPSGGATPTPTPTTIPAGSLAGKVNASGVNLRTGPSVNYTSLGLLNRDTAVTLLGTSGEWYLLTVNATGKSGYVFARYVTVTLATPTPKPTATPTPVPTATPTPTPVPTATPTPTPTPVPTATPTPTPTMMPVP